jgi:hypothetical protein
VVHTSKGKVMAVCPAQVCAAIFFSFCFVVVAFLYKSTAHCNALGMQLRCSFLQTDLVSLTLCGSSRAPGGEKKPPCNVLAVSGRFPPALGPQTADKCLGAHLTKLIPL